MWFMSAVCLCCIAKAHRLPAACFSAGCVHGRGCGRPKGLSYPTRLCSVGMALQLHMVPPSRHHSRIRTALFCTHCATGGSLCRRLIHARAEPEPAVLQQFAELLLDIVLSCRGDLPPQARRFLCVLLARWPRLCSSSLLQRWGMPGGVWAHCCGVGGWSDEVWEVAAPPPLEARDVNQWSMRSCC